MIATELRFPAGRFHATPWGRHVNEGVPEWPPSPWRLLRGLVAVWKRALPDLTEETVRPVLRALTEPPLFVLPPARTGHTRHFMPWFKKGPGDRTMVFDGFVVVERDAPVGVLWPDAVLDESERDTFAKLLTALGTLGRAESWCSARLLDAAEAERVQDQVNCRPWDGDLPSGHEVVRVLCADGDRAFEPWTALEAERGRGRRGRGGRHAGPALDPNWVLCAETAWLQRSGWSDPPGSRWVWYIRREDCLEGAPGVRAGGRVARPRPQVVRFALDSNVLPLATHALPVAEAARRKLLGLYGHLTGGGRSEILAGKRADGSPLEGHGHAYYLPTDEDGDGRLDHLTLVARAGFGAAEMRAVNRLEELRLGEGDAAAPVRVVLLGHGLLDDYRSGPLAPSRVWVSATPYLATRYAKTRGRERVDLQSVEQRVAFLVADLRSQLAMVRPDLGGMVERVEIRPLLEAGAFKVAGRWRPLQFKRFRQKRGDDGGRRLAGAFQLIFPEGVEVSGPLALGHSAHFGMGLFLPERS